jgi:hypothetical protein
MLASSRISLIDIQLNYSTSKFFEMKKLMVAILAVTLMASPALASNGGGGKKKARKKANIECKKDKSCDPKDCDPKCCDPKNCDPKCCNFQDACPKEEKGVSAPTCTGTK